jgi:tetratricopeptide (TPR) repeat protein/transcriptional regulator with XRE-family HTH domain
VVFGEQVRALRLRLGVSQEELARRAGIDAKTVRMIENGRRMPRPSTMRQLADALQLDDCDREAFYAAATPAAAHEPPVPPSKAPAQLPLDIRGFTGRQAHIDALDSIAAAAAQQPTAVVITAIDGTAGVGKTALAIHWAHQARARFPDGQLYINLRGFDPTGTVMNSSEAVRRFLDALDVPPERIPADPDAQAALYRTQLADRRMLILLDNARDPEQIRPLLPGAPGCLVLVTSRNQLTGLVATDGAHPLTLDLLTPNDARDLLITRLGADRVSAEPDAVDAIITHCARLPLALAIVAARAATRPQLPLAALANKLANAHARLDTLCAGETVTDIRAVFSWSYRTLTPDAARLFRLLGLHPGPDTSAAATASLAGIPPHQARPLLTELVHANLLLEHNPGRYALHDLLRAYAADLAHTTDTDQQRRVATQRILDHYLHTAHTAALRLNPSRDPITITPLVPGVSPETLPDHPTAVEWLTTEHRVLMAAITYATDNELDGHAWRLSWALTDFLDRRGHWHDWITTHTLALAATQRLGDRSDQALAHRSLARGYIKLGRYEDAAPHLHSSLRIYRELGDPVGQARVHLDLSESLQQQDRLAEAINQAESALTLSTASGDHVGQGRALNSIGCCHALLGDYGQTLTYCTRAVHQLGQVGDRRRQACAWAWLGYAQLRLHRHEEAITSTEQALRLYQSLGDRYNEADSLTDLGDAHNGAGNAHAARNAWQQALTILDDLDHPDTDKVRSRLGLAQQHHADH